LHDDGKVELWDLSSNFFLSEKDVGQNRAQACVPKLQELNNAVIISTITGDLSKEQLSNFQVHEHEMTCGLLRCFIVKNVFRLCKLTNKQVNMYQFSDKKVIRIPINNVLKENFMFKYTS